jgi:hypothetical protein
MALKANETRLPISCDLDLAKAKPKALLMAKMSVVVQMLLSGQNILP